MGLPSLPGWSLQPHQTRPRALGALRGPKAPKGLPASRAALSIIPPPPPPTSRPYWGAAAGPPEGAVLRAKAGGGGGVIGQEA